MKALIVSILLCTGASHALCVNTTQAYLRKGPSEQFEKTWAVKKYTPLRKLGSKGKWIKVKDMDQDLHWIRKDMTTNKFECAMIKADRVNLRQKPSVKAALSKMKKGSRYDVCKVLGRSKAWIHCESIKKHQFWIHEQFVFLSN